LRLRYSKRLRRGCLGRASRSPGGTDSGAGTGGIERSSALSTKSVPRRIHVQAGGTTNVLTCRKTVFRRVIFRRTRVRWSGGLSADAFGNKDVRRFALNFLQEPADGLLPFSRRIAEIDLSPAA